MAEFTASRAVSHLFNLFYFFRSGAPNARAQSRYLMQGTSVASSFRTLHRLGPLRSKRTPSTPYTSRVRQCRGVKSHAVRRPRRHPPQPLAGRAWLWRFVGFVFLTRLPHSILALIQIGINAVPVVLCLACNTGPRRARNDSTLFGPAGGPRTHRPMRVPALFPGLSVHLQTIIDKARI
jgi:hypothetical protein